MVKLVLFVKKEYNDILDAVDLTDNKTKVFGDYFLITAPKIGNLNKLIKNDRIVAAYCEGKAVIKKGIKSLSTEKRFMATRDFKKCCKRILSSEE